MDAMLDYPWWLLTFAGIGVLAILGGFVSLFFSLG